MKKQLPCYPIILFCLFILALQANAIVIQNIQGDDRLVDIRINCMYKDTDGFVWIGTGTTVERYDGVRSLCYPFTKDSFEPEECLVTSIIEREYHEYWAGNVKGLWKLDHIRQIPERMFPEKIDFMVRSLAKDEKNNLYIATPNGLYIYDGEQLYHLLIEKNTVSPVNQIVDVCVDSRQQVWLLTHSGVGLYDSRTGTIKYIPQNVFVPQLRFTCMTYQEEVLYLGTESHGIVSFDCKSFIYNSFSDVWKTPVTSLSGDGQTLLYVGSDGQGITILTTADQSVIFSMAYNPHGEGLTSNSVSCLLAEDNKHIWVGYKFYSGMDYIKLPNSPIDIFSTSHFDSEGLIIRSFCFDGQATLVGTREGFYYLASPSASPVHYLLKEKPGKPVRSNVIYSIYPYDGKYMIGTLREGMFILDPLTGEISSSGPFSTLADMDIFLFREDKEGNLWIPAVGGLSFYKKETGELTTYTPGNSDIPNHIVYTVLADSRDRIWVATGKGLSLFDKMTNSFRTDMFPPDFFTDKVIREIYEDNEGNLFFCLLDEGVVLVVNSELQPVKQLFESATSQVYNVIQDNAGEYWFGSSIGIIKGNRTLDKFVLYTEKDGLPDKNITPGSASFRDKEGKIWFATIKGLVCIDSCLPYEIDPVIITDLYVNGKNSYTCYTGLTDTNKLLKMKSNENNLTFRFVSLGYEDAETLLLEYQLEGMDNTWIPLSNKNEIVYYDVPPGTYTFKIRKFQNDDSLSTVSFVIKSSWRNSVFGLTVVLLLLPILWVKRRKPAAKNQEKEEAINHEENKEKYKYTRISEEEARAMIEKLTSYMHREKPYLNPDLKLPDLAAATGYSTNLLSQVINVFLNIRYYDFVNQYRVEEFQRLVRETDYSKYTLITLAEKCGFSSQASFFRFFKKSTGLTPSEYIQQIEKQKK